MRFFLAAFLIQLALAAPSSLERRQGKGKGKGKGKGSADPIPGTPTTTVFNEFTKPNGDACKSVVLIYSRGTGEPKNMVWNREVVAVQAQADQVKRES
jgi:hypothetical protein